MDKLKDCRRIFLISIFIFFSFNFSIAIASEKNEIVEDDNKTSFYLKTDSDSKIVYLTFDDGPSYKITNMLLDTLKENEVKATFFVVGKEIVGREYILKRIYEEGHSIGLHTYSHDFKKIYKSHNNFIEEMRSAEELVNSIIGIRPKVIRFPGGSSGILNDEFLNEIHENGYRVFDWNVDLCDGVNPNIPIERLIKNSMKAKGDQNNRIILAHCNYNNGNTCRALSSIIKCYKEKGFTFKAIDENTDEYYYKFKKKSK